MCATEEQKSALLQSRKKGFFFALLLLPSSFLLRCRPIVQVHALAPFSAAIPIQAASTSQTAQQCISLLPQATGQAGPCTLPLPARDLAAHCHLQHQDKPDALGRPPSPPGHSPARLGQLPRTMIILKSVINCIDNSGAALVECINVYGKKSAGRIGDRIGVVVRQHRSASSAGMAGISAAAKVRYGDVCNAVIVRTRYPTQRRDGSVVSFGDNACVLVTKSGEPVGTRINGVVASELRKKGWSKILSMAPQQV